MKPVVYAMQQLKIDGEFEPTKRHLKMAYKTNIEFKLGTTCAIYARIENRVEVELWYFRFQVLANTVRKCCVIQQQDDSS